MGSVGASFNDTEIWRTQSQHTAGMCLPSSMGLPPGTQALLPFSHPHPVQGRRNAIKSGAAQGVTKSRTGSMDRTRTNRVNN